MSSGGTQVILGLGNPGREYQGTRHNVGFDVVDRLAARRGRSFVKEGRSLLARGEGAAGPFVLAKPQTFMNLSGRAASEIVARATSTPVSVLVVCDDFHLPLGRLRCRRKGSSGGQKGLLSVCEALPGQDVARLRLGIGDPGRQPAEDFVLLPFRRTEAEGVAVMLDDAARHLDEWLDHGDLDRLMNAANASG